MQSEAQYGPTACSPVSCANGKCQADGACWPQNDREWARSHVDYADEVSPEQVRTIDVLTAPEFAIGNWIDVETESPPLQPDQIAYCRELADARRATWKAHAAATSQRTIIAFTGLAGSGKSTAAAHLVKHRGFERVRFAGPLKAMMAALGLTAAEIDGDRKEVPCELLGDKTPRWAMQRLGTEFGREMICDDLWIRAWKSALATVPAGVPVVVDDCRFANEAEAVMAAGGVIIRIERPGAGAGAAGHSSEGQTLPWSRIIHNTLSEQNLREQVDILLADLSWAERSVAV